MHKHLHEGFQNPVSTEVHGSEVDPQQSVDEVGIGPVVGADTHDTLEHPCGTQARIVCIDGCKRFLVNSFGLHIRRVLCGLPQQCNGLARNW